MQNLLNVKDRELILERISEINENSKALWGKMNAGEMIVHVADPIKTAFGEKRAEFIKSDYSEPGLRHEIIYNMEWPKDTPSSPEFISGMKGTDPEDFKNDLETLRKTIILFTEKSDKMRFSLHPMFGDISNEDWGRLMWKHLDHHLKQFGI